MSHAPPIFPAPRRAPRQLRPHFRERRRDQRRRTGLIAVAEYFALIFAGSLLPLILFKTWSHLDWQNTFVLIPNIAIVLYLTHRLLLSEDRF